MAADSAAKRRRLALMFCSFEIEFDRRTERVETDRELELAAAWGASEAEVGRELVLVVFAGTRVRF